MASFPAADKIIRSTFCAEGVLGGAKLFLIEDGSWFLVTTRWQIIGRRRNIHAAIDLFEKTAMGER